MDEGMTGAEARDHLLRLLASHFNWEDRGEALSTLNAFTVPNGTTFGDFLRQYRSAVNNITHFASLFSMDESWIVTITRNKINDQFSVMMSDCFPGEKRNVVQPYPSLDAMWRVLDTFTTSKVKAENGSPASMPNISGLSLHGNNRVGRQQGRTSPAPPQWSTQSTRSQPAARAKQPQVQDVFTVRYNSWPLATDEHWETVLNVCESQFSSSHLPPLWSPLLTTREHRATAFAENRGKCLNCHGTDHSMRECHQSYINASGVLNDMTDEELRIWQGRMRSYRTKVGSNQSSSGGRQSRGYSSSNPRRRGGRRRNNNGGGAQNTFRPPQPDSSSFNTHSLAPALALYQPQSARQPQQAGPAIMQANPIAANVNGRTPGSFNGRVSTHN